MTRTLINSLEVEVGKMQRQSETSKIRRSVAQLECKAENKLKEQMASHGSRVIFASNAVLQGLKSTPHNLVNYEDLEDAKRLREIEEEYAKQKQQDNLPPALKEGLRESLDNVAYEDLDELRVYLRVYKCRRNMLLN